MKINPKIFLKAAKLQFTRSFSGYSCDNIGRMIGDVYGGTKYHQIYEEYFKPNKPTRYDWYGWWAKNENEPRILALLLMYEITKDLDKKKKKKKS